MPLYIVATPIGNLEDITLRALETLRNADVILCEDTRVTSKLLARYEIRKTLIAYHQHSTLSRIDEIQHLLEEGKMLALVTDAGTPGINDPGNQLIAHLIETTQEGSISIVPIPGPNAAIAALSVSGFPTDRFLFLGFPPAKRKRQKFFADVAAAESAVVFFESPHRIVRTLEELAAAAPERQIMVARELTKKFETIYRGTSEVILNALKNKTKMRGEFVVVVRSA